MQGERHRTGVVLAFAAIYVIWGTTFLAITLMLRTIPPFAGAAIRFGCGALLLWLWLRTREPQPLASLPHRRLALTGVLLITGGNGLTVLAQEGIPSGVAALIAASVPVVVLLLDWLLFARRAPEPAALVGVLVGLCGVVLIVAHLRALSGNIRPQHVVALLCSTLCWCTGTLLTRRSVPAARIGAATCMQMLYGCGGLVLLGLVHGDWQQFHPAQVSLQSWLAVAYLAVFGTIIALSCYLWLLTQVSSHKVTTYALVNPLVALVLGAIVLGERISATELLAMVLILAGVALVLFQGRSRS